MQKKKLLSNVIEMKICEKSKKKKSRIENININLKNFEKTEKIKSIEKNKKNYVYMGIHSSEVLNSAPHKKAVVD